MLIASQIRPFLSHEAPPVRLLAARYLAALHDPSAVTADHLYAALDQRNDRGLLQFLPDFPHTEGSLRRAIESADAALLDRIVARLPWGFLLRFGDVVESAEPKLSPQIREHTRIRYEFATIDCETLWQQLTTPPIPDELAAQRYIEALARHPESAHRAIGQLEENTPASSFTAWSAMLLGEMRYRPAAAALVEKVLLGDSSTAMLDAIARINAIESLQTIVRSFANLPAPARTALATIFPRFHFAQTEANLRTLLAAETDSTVRAALIDAFCMLPAADAASLALLEREPNAALDALFVFNGRTRSAQLVKRPFAPIAKLEEPAWDEPVAPFEDDLAPADSKAPPATDTPSPVSKPAPIRRDIARVGRNDPCPCGSGKKFKKCCGR